MRVAADNVDAVKLSAGRVSKISGIELQVEGNLKVCSSQCQTQICSERKRLSLLCLMPGHCWSVLTQALDFISTRMQTASNFVRNYLVTDCARSNTCTLGINSSIFQDVKCIMSFGVGGDINLNPVKEILSWQVWRQLP